MSEKFYEKCRMVVEFHLAQGRIAFKEFFEVAELKERLGKGIELTKRDAARIFGMAGELRLGMSEPSENGMFEFSEAKFSEWLEFLRELQAAAEGAK